MSPQQPDHALAVQPLAVQPLVARALADRSIEVLSVAPEPDNASYGAQILATSAGTIRIRAGNVTPTKAGVFIAVWRRLESGQTGPFTHSDGVDFLLVTAQENERAGAFLIPTATLATRSIVSVAGKGGKRGFRLYPPWLTELNPQASRSQRWQAEFFQTLSTQPHLPC